MTEYVRDIFSYLVELEKKFPIERQNMRISLHMRSVLVNWINAVHYDFRLVPETYYLSVALIDRYLQQRKNFSRKFLQLLGITALLLASKYEETKPPSIHEFVNITDNSYTAHEVRLMEIKLLHYVEFNLNRPLPTHFLRRFSKAANATENIHGAANYFLELISLEYLMVHLRPSLMAAASIYLALRLLCPNEDGSSVWTSILENYTNYTEGEVLKVAKDVALLVIEAPDSTYQAIFSKYQNEKLGGISVLPEMSQAYRTPPSLELGPSALPVLYCADYSYRTPPSLEPTDPLQDRTNGHFDHLLCQCSTVPTIVLVGTTYRTPPSLELGLSALLLLYSYRTPPSLELGPSALLLLYCADYCTAYRTPPSLEPTDPLQDRTNGHWDHLLCQCSTVPTIVLVGTTYRTPPSLEPFDSPKHRTNGHWDHLLCQCSTGLSTIQVEVVLFYMINQILKSVALQED
ncbi:G2/mitotic-specific cyclin-B-like [Lutzomyia longipalpis]|uniref:G2/mitotic-specific cyclin-B-like n=1 Tax=Lutzomyia longipalpis TaxID=7200 RepID=UPI0024841DB7|nr:G2/mitotic-specific cyclin-B-like [Lutzomyia longipalpis]